MTLALEFWVTFTLLGIGVFVLVASSAFLGHAAARIQPKNSRVVWLLLALVAGWFGVALATSTAGLISFQLVIPFVFFPIIGGTLLSFMPQIAALIKEIPTHWLVALQTYRVAGGLFIFPYLTEGLLTRGFALNAGIGDIITGVLALPIAWFLLRMGSKAKWGFYAWTAFGILDLIVAPASAAYFGFASGGVQPDFPITIIPLFFGPPFGILIHIITLRNFRLRYI